MPQTTDPLAEERALAPLPPQDMPGAGDHNRSTQHQQTYPRAFPQENTPLGLQNSRAGLHGDRNSARRHSPSHEQQTETSAAAVAVSVSSLATADKESSNSGRFINRYNRPASDDRTEGAKRPREEHSHALLSSSQIPQHARHLSYGSGSASRHAEDQAQTQTPQLKTTLSPGSLVASHESSVSVSPAPSSSAAVSSRDNADKIASAPTAPPMQDNPRSSVLSIVSAAEPHPDDANRAVDQSDNRDESAANDADQSPKPDQTEDQDDDQNQGETGNNGSADSGSSKHQSQKRRLNQACLLCRRKKIRCDSTHPSCSNCKRRGIQCIYPEVRKRGRPPRTYTFADFVLPGQPLPPELQSISNVNASAMLLTPDHAGDQKRYGPPAGAAASAQHGWRSSAPGASSGSGYMHGLQPIESDMSGTSTPAYTHSDYGHSSGLPPLNAAFGRSSGAASSGYHHTPSRGMSDPMLQPPPPLAVDQAVLDLFEHVIPNFPIAHRQTVVQHIRDRSMPLPLWLAIHAVSARFESIHSGRAMHYHGHRNSGGSKSGAAYAEKARAMLVNRFGQRQSRLSQSRGDRSRMAAPQGLVHDLDEADSRLSRREVVELLQSFILLSIYYSGSWELELAVEMHASAVRIAQRMGVHLLDDLTKLPEPNGIFNTGAALHQRKRAESPGHISSGSLADPSTRWSMSDPPPLPGGPNDVDMHDVSELYPNEGAQTASAAPVSAELRQNQIEFETLRRLWWSMFILDRMYFTCAGVPRVIPISGFRVRLPCSDLDWDSMSHACPSATSPTSAGNTAAESSQSSRLMVRTFREAVMHTSLTEQTANEIAATPSKDPEVFRYFAALAGLVDSVVDLGDDIRTLVSPSIVEGTDILAQLRIEKRTADQADEASGYGSGFGGSMYSHYGSSLHEGTRGNAEIGGAKLPSTVTWLGSQRARQRFSRTSHAGWVSASTSAAWPPDWRSRMRVLQERVAELEAQFTEWYSAMPIAQYARKPYLYSQLPLQDRITYFHQQIVYYGCVIQLQSLVLMAQGLLLPDTVDDSAAAPGLASIGSTEYDPLFGPSALTDMLWRSLMDMEIGQRHGAGNQQQRLQNDIVGEPAYASRRRQFGSLSSWAARRPYRAGMDDTQDEGHGHGDDGANDDGMALVPLDEGGNSPEIVREELQRMVQAAWRRCTEAALAMSTAVKRATEVHRVASANPKVSYYDPTFRPQVLPPYRGDVASDRIETHSPFAAASSSRLGPIPAVGEMTTSPQQHHSPSISLPPAHGYTDGPRLPPIDRREPSGPSAHILPYPPSTAPSHSNSPGMPGAGRFAESALGPGQVIDDATLFMRYNMFTCSAAYAGAFIHMQNLKLIPRWEEAARGHSETAAKANEMRIAGDVAMASGRDEQDLGFLPPPLPPPLPSPPCALNKARDGVKPLVKLLESIMPYWSVSGHVSRLRQMWRDVEGSELPIAPLTSPPMRPSAHVYPPTAPVGSGTASGQGAVPAHPMPMSSTDHAQWGGHVHGSKVLSPPQLHPQKPQQLHYLGQQQQQQQQLQQQPPPPPLQQPNIHHHRTLPPPRIHAHPQHMPNSAHSRQPSTTGGHQIMPQQQQHMSMFPPRP